MQKRAEQQACRRRLKARETEAIPPVTRTPITLEIVFDDTVNRWGFMSSLWRRTRPSPRMVVSFQRTARVVRGTPTRKERPRGTGQAIPLLRVLLGVSPASGRSRVT